MTEQWHITQGQWTLLLVVPVALLYVAAWVNFSASLHKKESQLWMVMLAAIAYVVSLVIRYKANLLFFPGLLKPDGLTHEPLRRLTPEQLTPVQADHIAWASNIGFAATVVALLLLFRSMGASPRALLIGLVLSAMIVILYRHFALA